MAMMRQPENFQETVKEVRQQLGLSQKELAHALAVSFATVNRWENGKTEPSKLALRQFEQLCKQERINLSNFYSATESNKKDSA